MDTIITEEYYKESEKAFYKMLDKIKMCSRSHIILKYVEETKKQLAAEPAETTLRFFIEYSFHSEEKRSFKEFFTEERFTNFIQNIHNNPGIVIICLAILLAEKASNLSSN